MDDRAFVAVNSWCFPKIELLSQPDSWQIFDAVGMILGSNACCTPNEIGPRENTPVADFIVKAVCALAMISLVIRFVEVLYEVLYYPVNAVLAAVAQVIVHLPILLALYLVRMVIAMPVAVWWYLWWLVTSASQLVAVTFTLGVLWDLRADTEQALGDQIRQLVAMQEARAAHT